MKENNFTKFNNSIWKDRQLKSNEKLVLIYLISYHNNKLKYAYPTRKQIQDDTGISENTLSKIFKSLEGKGYIKREKHKTSKGTNNIYYINKYLVSDKQNKSTLSEPSVTPTENKSTNSSSETKEPLTNENREPVELTVNEKLIHENVKLNHNLAEAQKEQINKLDTDKLNRAIVQANRFAKDNYSLNYLLAIYNNASKPEPNTKPLTRYHNSFNEHYKNYTEDELEAKLLRIQNKERGLVI